jgi:hypothetical protein
MDGVREGKRYTDTRYTDNPGILRDCEKLKEEKSPFWGESPLPLRHSYPMHLLAAAEKAYCLKITTKITTKITATITQTIS